VPDIDVYAIDVSFAALHDRKEMEYLNDLPTSFALVAGGGRPPAQRGRPRWCAESPEFARLLRELTTDAVR
jgi:hypothetical protein